MQISYRCSVPEQYLERIFFVEEMKNGSITGQYWLVIDGTGSVWGNTGCNLVVLGQYRVA